METLLQRGITEKDDGGAITGAEATNLAQFCTGMEPEVEREAQHLLTTIGILRKKSRCTSTLRASATVSQKR